MTPTEMLRREALDRAIRFLADHDNLVTDASAVVNTAREFEAFLKGDDA